MKEVRAVFITVFAANLFQIALAVPAVCPSGWSGLANTTDGSVRCFSLRQERLAPINIDFFCRSLTNLGATSVSVHSSTEASFIRSLQPVDQCKPIALGGLVGYDEKAWFDHSPFDYTSPLSQDASDGCLVANCDGSWSTTPCSDEVFSFVCAVLLKPIPSDGQGGTLPPSKPNATERPSPTPTSPPRAPRPPASSTSCPPQWEFNEQSGKCYQVFLNTFLTMQQAEARCMKEHPLGHVSSVLDASENSFIAQLASQQMVESVFIGGLFMSSGSIGSWYEDSSWYVGDAYTIASPSSPSWPTVTNRYYANWAVSEPIESFGCIRMSSADGKWYHANCQSPLAYVCSFINDGSTFPPAPVVSSIAPSITTLPPLPCIRGWEGLHSTRKCYRVVAEPVTGFGAEAACQASIPDAPSDSIHTTSITASDESALFARLVAQAEVKEALIGLAFISYGADGMFTDMRTDWEPSSKLVKTLWAAGQPSVESGCVAMARDGYLAAKACDQTLRAALCSYDASISMPEGGTTKPPMPTDAYPPGAVGTVISLNYRQRIVVASSSRGIYTVQFANGNVEGKFLLFSPIDGCEFSARQGYAAPIFKGKVAVNHGFPVANGTVCFSPDGLNYVPTGIRFTVIDTALSGLIPTDFSDWRTGRTVSKLLSTPLAAEITIQRRSSGVLYLVGRNIMDSIKAVRFSSNPDCMTSLYTYGTPTLNVTGELATFELIDIQPLNFSNFVALDDRRSTDPVFRYFVCVSVANGDSVFTNVPGLHIMVPPVPVRVDGFILNNGAVNTTLTISQYATPTVQLAATGLSVAMLFYLSSRPHTCQFVEDLPLYPDPYDKSGLPRLTTSLPVYVDSSFTGKGVPYIRFSLNHTRLEGYPLFGEDVTFYVCMGMTSYEPPQPTTLKVVIRRQTVEKLLLDGEGVTEVSSSIRTMNVGFSGMLQLDGFSFDGMSLETKSTIRVAFAPSSPASTASAVVNPCSNHSAFYRQMTFPLVDISSLRREGGAIYEDAAIVLAPGVVDREVTRRMHVCLSVVHSHDSPSRVFVPTKAYLDVRRIEVMYIGTVGASMANDRGMDTYATVTVPENADDFILPLVGYGIRADMTVFLSQSPCFLNGASPAEYMSQHSLLNMSIHDLYDVPLSLREESVRVLGRSRASIPFIVLTRANHTNTSIARRLFGDENRNPLWLCMRTPGVNEGILPLPFRFIIKSPYVTSIVRADNASSSQVQYSSSVDLLVTGFGLKEGATQMVPALDCNNPTTYLWWSPVPLTTVPLTIPNGQNYVRSSNTVSGFGSFFLSLTPDQTVRMGSMKQNNSQQFAWCVLYDPVLRYSPIPFDYSVTLPSITGFVNPEMPSQINPTLYLLTAPKSGSDFTVFRLTGSIVENVNNSDTDILYLAFVASNTSCESITSGTVIRNADEWVVVVNGSGVILPTQIPPAGQYKVCFSAVLPTFAKGAIYQASLRFIEAKGLRLVVSVPTFALFTINNTASLTVLTRQEWILPVDGVGISNRTVLRITNRSDCSPIWGIEDIPVYMARDSMLIFGRRSAYYIFVPTQTTRSIATGKYSVCMLPTPSRTWVTSKVAFNLKPRIRQPTWYNYFSDEAEGNVSAVVAQLPTRIARANGASFAYAAKGMEVSLYMQCGVRPCPDRARVILARSDSPASRPDPCFIDEFDFPGEFAKGPFVLHDGFLTLTANTTTELFSTMGPQLNWTLCVETGPNSWRQPRRPHVYLSVVDTLPTQILEVPDDNNNSTFDAPYPSGFEFEVSAGGPTRVYFINGVGIRRGTKIRFGPNCTSSVNSTLSESAAMMKNPQLLTQPLSVNDERGAFFLPASHYPNEEAIRLPMCFAAVDADSGAESPYAPTNVYLQVSESSHRVDDVSGRVDTSHTPQGALQDTIQLPCTSRGTIDLTKLKLRNGAEYLWTSGSFVMFSRDCLSNTEGTALMKVDSNLNVAVTRNHTASPTGTPLQVCVRKLISFVALTDRGEEVQTAFETGTFVPTGFKFQVAAVMVKSVSVSPMEALKTGGNDDVRFVVAVKAEEELVLRMTLLPSPKSEAPPPTGSTVDDYFDGILARMSDPAALVGFGLLKLTAGRPCSTPANEQDVATVRSLLDQEVIFNERGTTVSEKANEDNNEYYVNLKDFPAGTWGDPLHPKSFCMSADGGRTFVSVGIAIFDMEWQPTLAVLNTNPVTGQVQVLNEVSVYENTELVIEIVDRRYNKHFRDLRDQTMAALANFAEIALWDGFLNNGFGIIEGMRLLLSSSYLSPGEDPTFPLLFTSDAIHSGVNTGVSLTLLEYKLICAESGSTVVYSHHLEPGATFDIAPGVCAFGLNDGSMVRYAHSCANATKKFIGDGIITNSRLTAPSTVAFIDYGTYEVCLKKYLDPIDVPSFGAEAVYAPTGLTLVVSSKVGVNAVNDVSSGTLAMYQGEEAVFVLSGSGVGNGNVLLSLPSASSDCNAATHFVDAKGADTMSTIDPLATWVDVVNSVGTLNGTATSTVVPGEAGKRLVCVSINGGISFSHVGKKESPLYAMIVPPTITNVGSLYDHVAQTSNVLSTLRIVTNPNATDDPLVGPHATAVPPLHVFSEGIFLQGNGIGSFSQRTAPLLAAIFPTIEVEACNGFVDLSMAVATLEVDPRTGRARSVPGANWSSMLTNLNSPSSAYVLCTSADAGRTFYSANGNFLPLTIRKGSSGASLEHSVGVTNANTIQLVEEYGRDVFFIRFDSGMDGNRRDDDATLLLDTMVFSTIPNRTLKGFDMDSFDLNAIQKGFAEAIGVSPIFVAVVVSAMPLANVSNSYHIGIKMLGSAVGVTRGSDGMISRGFITPPIAYTRWVEILTAVGDSSDDAYRRGNLTKAIEANITSTTRISVLRSSFACSDGWPASPKDNPNLIGLSVDIVASTVRGYSGQVTMGETSWSTIPILLLFPCFLFIATYFAYKRFFGVIEGGESNPTGTA